jgi:DNA polymerase-4
LRQVSIALVRTVLPAPKGIRLLGVTVSNFDQDAGTQALPLFGADAD